jgi:hypothetical protein
MPGSTPRITPPPTKTDPAGCWKTTFLEKMLIFRVYLDFGDGINHETVTFADNPNCSESIGK